jgi:hypothetical protein
MIFDFSKAKDVVTRLSVLIEDLAKEIGPRFDVALAELLIAKGGRRLVGVDPKSVPSATTLPDAEGTEDCPRTGVSKSYKNTCDLYETLEVRL